MTFHKNETKRCFV